MIQFPEEPWTEGRTEGRTETSTRGPKQAVTNKQVAFSHEYVSSRLSLFFKIVVLKSFAIFTGEQLCRSLFLIKLQT